MSPPVISVVIRVKDEASAMARTLDLLAGQTVAHQLVVVDSGSTDGTLDVIRRHPVELVEIPPESFTYGGALNTGTEHAGAEVVVALSAHSFPPDERWLERMLDAMAVEQVACASGHDRGPDGQPLRERVVQDAALYRAHPRWGYSSHAGAFRRSLWQERPFRADLPASEDKEWAWHWLQRGHTAVLGPDLMVEHSHSRDPVRGQFRRRRTDWVGIGMFFPVQPQTAGELVAAWWGDVGAHDSAMRARLSHRRLARLLGDYAGRRAAARRS